MKSYHFRLTDDAEHSVSKMYYFGFPEPPTQSMTLSSPLLPVQSVNLICTSYYTDTLHVNFTGMCNQVSVGGILPYTCTKAFSEMLKTFKKLSRQWLFLCMT